MYENHTSTLSVYHKKNNVKSTFLVAFWQCGAIVQLWKNDHLTSTQMTTQTRRKIIKIYIFFHVNYVLDIVVGSGCWGSRGYYPFSWGVGVSQELDLDIPKYQLAYLRIFWGIPKIWLLNTTRSGTPHEHRERSKLTQHHLPTPIQLMSFISFSSLL